MRWVRAAGSNVAIRIAAQPLQIETWLLFDSLRKVAVALSNNTTADPLRRTV